MKILAPAIILLTVEAAGLLYKLTNFKTGIKILYLLILTATITSFIQNITIPFSPFDIPHPYLKNCKRAAFANNPNYAELVFRSVSLEEGAKILTDLPNVHSTLQRLRYEGVAGLRNIEVIPVWSPEVSFIFDREIDPDAVSKKLEQIGVDYIITDRGPGNLNYVFLGNYPFFSELSTNSKLLASAPFMELRQIYFKP
jgi:hypothetical protein